MPVWLSTVKSDSASIRFASLPAISNLGRHLANPDVCNTCLEGQVVTLGKLIINSTGVSSVIWKVQNLVMMDQNVDL